jgi:hypothetical protein
LSGPRQRRCAPRDVWVNLRPERHSTRRTGQNDLSRRDALDAPIIHRLPLAADHRLGTGDGKNRQVAPGLDDDPGQPQIREIEIGLIGTPARRLAGRAEQRVAQDGRDKLFDARALCPGLFLRLLSSRNGCAGGAIGITRDQFNDNHGGEQRTADKEQGHTPVDHR